MNGAENERPNRSLNAVWPQLRLSRAGGFSEGDEESGLPGLCFGADHDRATRLHRVVRNTAHQCVRGNSPDRLLGGAVRIHVRMGETAFAIPLVVAFWVRLSICAMCGCARCCRYGLNARGSCGNLRDIEDAAIESCEQSSISASSSRTPLQRAQRRLPWSVPLSFPLF